MKKNRVMATSIEYRLTTAAGEQLHQRPQEEGVYVQMSAMSSAPGQEPLELDLSQSTDASIFNSNYASFKAENELCSVSNVDNAYFREIVNMGRRAVPYIYKELKKGPTDLVYALDIIFDHPIKYPGFIPLKQSCDLWLSILRKTGISL